MKFVKSYFNFVLDKFIKPKDYYYNTSILGFLAVVILVLFKYIIGLIMLIPLCYIIAPVAIVIQSIHDFKKEFGVTHD